MKQASQAPRQRWKFAAMTVAVLVIALVISRVLVATAPQAERQVVEREARLVEVQSVTATTQTLHLSAYGEVEAAQRLQLSAQVSGMVEALSPNFVPGARIKSGDWLLRIEQQDFRLALARARADLQAAEAAWVQEQGQQVVARADLELLDTPLSESERALMLREPQLRSALAAVESARAAVKAAELDLARTELRAPFDAQVMSRSTAVGAQVGGVTTVLGELVADQSYWVHLMLPAQSLRWVELPDAPGQTGAAVELSDASRPGVGPWQGRVIQLLGQLETSGRRAQLLVEVDPVAPDGSRLLLGSYVKARIQGRELESVLRLDPAWVQDQSIWVLKDKRLHQVKLEVLHRDESAVLARADLAPGTLVLTSALASAVDGMRVRTAAVASGSAP